MDSKKKTKTSKFMSLVLRHKPEIAGIKLDEHGWAEVDDLLIALSISMEELQEIVNTDEKQRYSFNEAKTKIRANQGHSIPVNLGLKPSSPPEILYHGTATKNLDGIMKYGLTGRGRNYVHLSDSVETAMNVGKRHGTPIVLSIDAGVLESIGHKFHLSENGVWLTDFVPRQYISILGVID